MYEVRASVLLCCRGFGLLLLRFEVLGFARFWFLGLGLGLGLGLAGGFWCRCWWAL